MSCSALMWIVCVVALGIFAGESRAARRYDLVIGADTDERIAAGENPLELPTEWSLESGDVLVLDNRESSSQTIGAWTVAPGEVREIVLRPFSGLVQCTLHPDGEITMSVHPGRADWKLPLLATSLFGPSLGIGAIAIARVVRSLDGRPSGGASAGGHDDASAVRWLWITTGALLIGATITGAVVLRPSDVDAATLDGFVESPARDVGALALPDARTGTPFAFRAPADGVLLVVFGYTSCPDVCPATLAALQRATADLAGQRDRVSLAFVTVDPARDTSDRLADYIEYFDADGHGLRTDDPVALRRIAEAFGVTYELGDVTADGGYEVSHTSLVYGVDTTGHVVVSWPADLGADAVTHDLRLLLERSAPGEDPA